MEEALHVLDWRLLEVLDTESAICLQLLWVWPQLVELDEQTKNLDKLSDNTRTAI